MRKLLAIILLLTTTICRSQIQPAVIDSMKARISTAKTDADKVELLGNLARTLMNVNLVEADKYGFEMITIAEQSRDRKLMIKALLTNGERYSYLSGRRENINKAIDYYNQGLEMARANEYEDLMISSYLFLSEVHRYIPDPEKALSYSNQALSYAGLLKNDSLLAKVYLWIKFFRLVFLCR